MQPGSNVHPGKELDGDWDDERHLKPLRNVVTKARDLFQHFSDSDAPSLNNEFELAWNGIMPNRLRRRERKQD